MKRLVLAALLAVCGLDFSQNAFAAGMQVTGSLPRSLETGAFTVQVIVTGVFPTDLAAGRGESTENRISIELTQVDQSPIGFSQQKAQTANARFYLQERLLPVELPDNNGNYTVTSNLWVREAVPGELKNRITTGKLTMRLNYSIAGKNIVRDFLTELSQDAYVVNEAPTFTQGSAIIGSQKSLLVNFDTKSTVAAKGGDNSAKEPTSVNVYIVDPDVTGELVSLPAKRFSGQATVADANATCTFRLPIDDKSTCVFDCKDINGTTGDVYLNDAEISSIPGFTVTTVPAKDGQASVVGLTNGKRYYTFLQYEPDGVLVSDCLAGEPSANLSLTELNGEGEAQVVDVRCFIATAAYGSPLHDRLKLFRKFRDQVLMDSAPGRALVELYYRWSPPLAAWIAAHPSAKEVTRRLLEIPATALGLVDDLY